MSISKGICPSCAHTILFKSSTSLSAVCEDCCSLLERKGSHLLDLGKVDSLTVSTSTLNVGQQGEYRGSPFELVGWAHFRHEFDYMKGGFWVEWYAAFQDGRWGWITETSSHIYIAFKSHLDRAFPPFDKMSRHGHIKEVEALKDMEITEQENAHYSNAGGELPYLFVLGMEHPYVDFEDHHGGFATLDYYPDGRQFLFVGREVSLKELGLAPMPSVK